MKPVITDGSLRRRKLRGTTQLLCVAWLLLEFSTAGATENGLSIFPVGALTVASGFLPPPDHTELYAYSLFYSADSFRDNAGKPIPGLKADLAAVAPRLIHTWHTTLDGFSFSSGVLAEAAYVKVKIPGNRDEALGLDLVGVEPIDISKAFGDWHLVTGPIFYLPVGQYHRDDLANSSTHYAAYAHQFDATWAPNARFELSLTGDIEINLRNKATGYRSGDQSGVTYGVGYRPFASNLKWDLGFSGYYAYQFTDDHLHGDAVPNGYRLRKDAIGPKVVYWFSPATAVVVQWHHEWDVRNGPKGDLYWIEGAFPL